MIRHLIVRVLVGGLVPSLLVEGACGEPYVMDTAIVMPLVCELGTEVGAALGEGHGAACELCDKDPCFHQSGDLPEIESICSEHTYRGADAKHEPAATCGSAYAIYYNCCVEAMNSAWTTAAAAAGCPEEAECSEGLF